MARTQLHDIEICIEEGKFKIIPYKLMISADGYLTGDYSEAGQSPMFECDLQHKANRDLIGYVLRRPNWHETRTYWEDFSEWDTTEYLHKGDAPDRLRKWLNKLPIYEVTL